MFWLQFGQGNSMTKSESAVFMGASFCLQLGVENPDCAHLGAPTTYFQIWPDLADQQTALQGVA